MLHALARVHVDLGAFVLASISACAVDPVVAEYCEPATTDPCARMPSARTMCSVLVARTAQHGTLAVNHTTCVAKALCPLLGRSRRQFACCAVPVLVLRVVEVWRSVAW